MVTCKNWMLSGHHKHQHKHAYYALRIEKRSDCLCSVGPTVYVLGFHLCEHLKDWGLEGGAALKPPNSTTDAKNHSSQLLEDTAESIFPLVKDCCMPFFCVQLPPSRGKWQMQCASQCTFAFPHLGFWPESMTVFLVLINTKEISRTPSLKVQTTQCFAHMAVLPAPPRCHRQSLSECDVPSEPFQFTNLYWPSGTVL